MGKEQSTPVTLSPGPNVKEKVKRERNRHHGISIIAQQEKQAITAKKKKGKEKGVVNKLSFQYSSRWNKKKEDKLNEHC